MQAIIYTRYNVNNDTVARENYFSISGIILHFSTKPPSRETSFFDIISTILVNYSTEFDVFLRVTVAIIITTESWNNDKITSVS